MKKLALAFATMAAMGSASVMADTGTVSFMWNGSVPELTTSSDGFFIVPAVGSKGFQDGTLTFKNDINEGVTLESADALAFVVYKDVDGDGAYDAAVDVDQVQSFNYELSYFKVGVNQTPQFYTEDYFGITANGNPIEPNAGVVSHTSTEPVSFTIVGDNTVAKEDRGIEAHDTVQIQAVVALSNVTL